MKDFHRRLFESSVFRPVRISMEIESIESLKKYVCASENEDELSSFLYRLSFISEGDIEHGSLQGIIRQEIQADNPLRVALLGEFFVETTQWNHYLSDEVIREYFTFLKSRSTVFGCFSKGLFLLNRFQVVGDQSDLLGAIAEFKRAMLDGNITASILYNRLQLAILKDRRQLGKYFSYYLGRLGLLLSMIPPFLASVEGITVNRWWRYGEVERFMPARVKALDEALRTRRVRWNLDVSTKSIN